MLADMPYVDHAIVEALVSAYNRQGRPITIPVYGQEVGPPTLFARSIFAELLRLEGEVGGRQLVTNYPESACLVPFAEDQRPPDIDTPENYREML